MRIPIASDHGGYELKQQLIAYLTEEGHEVIDYGTDSVERVDFPDYVEPVTKDVLEHHTRGILLCGTGIGMCMAANKVHGIRAAHCNNAFEATYAVRDDNMNILCLGGRTVGRNLAIDIVEHYLQATFAGGRYQERYDKIADIEQQQS